MKGFSLIELLTTLAVVMILIGITAPDMRSFFSGSYVINGVDLLFSSVSLARNEALRRGHSVTLCRISATDEEVCATEGVNWSTGWIIFVDLNSNGVINTDDEVIKVYQAQPENLSIIWNRNHFLRFNRLGQVREAGTFTLCAEDQIRTLSISLTGRGRIDKTGTCI